MQLLEQEVGKRRDAGSPATAAQWCPNSLADMCLQPYVQAYVRVLEQEVAEAAEKQAALQQQLADAPAGAAQQAAQLRDRATATGAQVAEVLQRLQLERHRYFTYLCIVFAYVCLRRPLRHQ